MSEGEWRRPAVNEALAVLYLRLNGYFTTGLVLHSSESGRNETEIDVLAIRHPNHAQLDRVVVSAPFLGLETGLIDLLICEVKSVPAKVAFNPRLCNPKVLQRVLEWAGVLPKEEVQRVAAELIPILQAGLGASGAHAGVSAPHLRVRGLLCCPPASDGDLPTGWCLRGSEIMRYVTECFSPDVARDTCSTRYNFVQWGRQLSPIVQYFKSLEDPARASVAGLHQALGAA